MLPRDDEEVDLAAAFEDAAERSSFNGTSSERPQTFLT